MTHRGPDDSGYVFFKSTGNNKIKSIWREYSDNDFRKMTPDLQLYPFGSQNHDLDESYFLVLGHRRLSILDLSSAGHQPMANKDKTIWITYNGEIYNYLELKEELVNDGYQFDSKTDTEVII